MTSYLGVIRTVMLADTSQFNLAMAGATRTTRASAMAMRTSAQSLVGIGAALNLGITIPTLLAVRAISKVGIEFDSNMMKIRNVTDMTSDTLNKFKDAQKGLSNTVAMSQLDLSKIAYIGGQAQLKTVAQLTEFQKGIANTQLAYPNDAPIETMASGFASVINSFGIQVGDYEKTMAEMVQTTNLGSLSWENYTHTIQQVVGLASSLKDPLAFQKLNVAMAMATQGGVQGSQVATATRNLYHRIYKENAQANSPLNIAAKSQKYTNAADMFERGANKDLITYAKMLTDNGKNATLKRATDLGFGNRELTDFLKLANASSAQIKEFRDKMANALPLYAKQVEEAQKNPETIMKRLSTSFTNLKLSFWPVIEPSLLKFVEGLTRLLDTISKLPDATKKLLFASTVLLSVGSAFLLLVGILKSAALSLTLSDSIGKEVGPGAVTARNAARATTDAVKEQILRTKLARETALTNGVLARNIANAAKVTKGSEKTAKDAIQEQILKAKLARETALTNGVLARNIANAAKVTKGSEKTAKDAIQEQILKAKLARETALTNGVLARNAERAAANAAKAAAKGRKTANASTVLAGMTVSDIIKKAKDAVNKVRPGYRTGTAFQNQYPIVLRDPFTSALHPTKKVGGWTQPSTVYRGGKWIDNIGGFKEKARAASQFLPALALNFRHYPKFGSASRLYRPNFTRRPAGANIVRRSAAGVQKYEAPYTGTTAMTPRYSGNLMGIPTPTPSRHRNPTFAPYVGGGSMFSGVVPKFFESIKTQSLALLPIIGKWTVVGARFSGIGLLIFALFKALGDALSVTLSPALRECDIDVKDLAAALTVVTTILDYVVKGITVGFVTVIHIVEWVVSLIFGVVHTIWDTFKWLHDKIHNLNPFAHTLGSDKDELEEKVKGKKARWTQLGMTPEQQAVQEKKYRELNSKSKESLFKDITFAPSTSLMEKFSNLFLKWLAAPKLKNTFDQKAIDQKTNTETLAINNALARAPTNKFADFAEYGTQAGFNAVNEARAGAAEEVRKLREQAAQQHIEQIKADAENTKMVTDAVGAGTTAVQNS